MTTALRLQDICFTYRRAAQPALQNVELALEAGSVVGLTGRTGAGKTTCARICNGLVPYVLKGEFSGRVELFGEPLARQNRHSATRRIGLVFQDFEAQLFSTTLRGEVAFSLECQGLPRPEMLPRIDEALRRVGLLPLAEREPSTLSGGQKQRLAIACLLAAKPDVFIFDEPTTDLDPQGKLEIATLLGEICDEGHCALIIEHEHALLARAGVLHLLQDGRMRAAGTLGSFALSPDTLRDYGVQPPDLPRLWQLLGLSGPPTSVPMALEALKQLDYVADPHALPAAIAKTDDWLLDMQQVSFAYPQGPAIFRRLDLQFRRGETVALLGANGAGKTTLAGLLNGLKRPTAGRIVFAGRDIAPLSIGELGRNIGYVFQNPDHQIFAPTVLDEVAFSLKIRLVPMAQRQAKVEQTLARVGLSGMEARDPFVMTKGERQKLALASTLVHEPEVLILDEPTTGLDAVDQENMIALLRELAAQGHTLLIITHSMDTALAVAQRTIVLADGGILVDGPTREVFAKGDLLAAAHLCAPEAAQLSARLGLGALPVGVLARCLKRSGA